MSIIPAGITRPVFRALLHGKKHAPTIMFAGGVVGAVTSTVLACRATLKLADELPEMRKNLDIVNEGRDLMSDNEYKKALVLTYTSNGARMVQLYAPSVIVGSLAISALTGSHVQLTRRNSALTATAAGISRAYDEYRARVREEMGEEKERDIYEGVHIEAVDVKGGKTKEVRVKDPTVNGSIYARVFDEYNMNWKPQGELNRNFLQCQQNYFNHVLQAKGHVFLNDVYTALGMEECKAGQIVGWVYGNGDNYISFGCFDGKDNRFINLQEPSVWLDFNVDGDILDLIGR